MAGGVEHFDVYGEVRTMYSQVYWTRNDPIALPPEIVERFRGKVMAITGKRLCVRRPPTKELLTYNYNNTLRN